VRAKATTEDHIGQFKLYIELPLVDSAGNKDTIAYYRRSSKSETIFTEKQRKSVQLQKESRTLVSFFRKMQ